MSRASILTILQTELPQLKRLQLFAVCVSLQKRIYEESLIFERITVQQKKQLRKFSDIFLDIPVNLGHVNGETTLKDSETKNDIQNTLK